jgi:hypothetical protein
MALNKLGVVDLSFITRSLLDLLQDAIDNSPLWAQPPGAPGAVPGFAIDPPTGDAPDVIKARDHCQLGLFLFHVAPDPYQRNAAVFGSRAQTIPALPLSLNLYYLLSAYSDGNYLQEQQVMSIAMQCFHQNPIVRVNVPLRLNPSLAAIDNVPEEFTLTMESETVDSLSRLWQSTTAAIRLSAVYKASVIFITPPATATGPATPVETISLAADPVALPFATNGHLIGAYRRVTYTSPLSSVAVPKIVQYDSSTATVASGQTLILYGSRLSDGGGKQNPTAKRLYLLKPNGTEQEVSGWIVADPDPTNPAKTVFLDSRLTLRLPPGVPDPGVYQLRVGSDMSEGDPVTYRSNAVPISIAPSITGLPAAPSAPLLPAGTTTITGAGFLTGKIEVLFGPFVLAEGPAAPGSFQLTGATQIDFQPPANLPTGFYPVRIRVNHVEADPAWWVRI